MVILGTDGNDGGDVNNISQVVDKRKAPNGHSVSVASRSASNAMTVAGMCGYVKCIGCDL